MGQVPPKFFLPSAPYGSSEGINALNPTQAAAQNPQTPLLPPNFSDPGTQQQSAVQSITGPSAAANPLAARNRQAGGFGGAMFGRGLFSALLLLLLALPSWATTTVSGTIQNLGTGNIGTSGAFVRFWLRGCGGNQPRVNGTSVIGPSQGGVFFFDLAANSSGVVSGTIYSTRDATGLLGGDIECGGVKTAVWYGMQIFVAGKGGPEIPVHALNTGTLDITQVTPITTNPVVAAPTGDSTYFRKDAGNSPINGNVAINGGLGNNVPGVFTGTQMNIPYTFSTNSINFGTEFFATQGFNATQGLSSGVAIPSSSTVPEADGVFGVMTNSSTATNAVGGRFQVRALANNTSNWPLVGVCGDDGSRTTGVSCIGFELDVGPQSPVSSWSGMFGFDAVRAGNALGTVGGSAAFIAGGNGPGNSGTNTCGAATVGCWDFGLLLADNRIKTAGILLGAKCVVSGANSCTSQPIQFRSSNSGSAVTGSIFTDNLGNITLQPVNTTQGINIQGPLFCTEQVAPSGSASNDLLWCDSAAHRWKMNNNNGGADTVVGAATTDTFSNKSTAAGPLTGTVASGAQALNTASVTTATCDAGVAATANGTLSTDRVIWSFNAAPTATNKYGAFLVVYAVPSTNTVTFYTCNPSATTSTPTAMTVNWSVVR